MNDVDVFVGARIRAQRIARGMSQTDLGNAIGVRFQQVQKYESGANRVSASRLWAIADALGVDVSHFFEGIGGTAAGGDGGGGGRGSGRGGDGLAADPRTQEAARLFDTLPENQKNAVLSFLRSLTPGRKGGNLGSEGGRD